MNVSLNDLDPDILHLISLLLDVYSNTNLRSTSKTLRDKIDHIGLTNRRSENMREDLQFWNVFYSKRKFLIDTDYISKQPLDIFDEEFLSFELYRTISDNWIMLETENPVLFNNDYDGLRSVPKMIFGFQYREFENLILGSSGDDCCVILSDDFNDTNYSKTKILITTSEVLLIPNFGSAREDWIKLANNNNFDRNEKWFTIIQKNSKLNITFFNKNRLVNFSKKFDYNFDKNTKLKVIVDDEEGYVYILLIYLDKDDKIMEIFATFYDDIIKVKDNQYLYYEFKNYDSIYDIKDNKIYTPAEVDSKLFMKVDDSFEEFKIKVI